MFCTNCGNSISGAATFCAKCGTHVGGSSLPMGYARQPRSAAVGCQDAMFVMPAAHVPSAAHAGAGLGVGAVGAQGYGVAHGASASFARQARENTHTASANAEPLVGFTPLGIVARVAAALTAILMFLPWLEVPALQTLGEYAALLGIDLPTDFAYSMPQMDSVSRVLDMLTSSNAYSSFQTAFFALWLVALLAIGAGMVLSFIGKRSSAVLVPGGALAALVAILWFAAITYLDGEYSRQLAQLVGFQLEFFSVTPAVWAAVVTGAATSILGVLGKQR